MYEQLIMHFSQIHCTYSCTAHLKQTTRNCMMLASNIACTLAAPNNYSQAKIIPNNINVLWFHSDFTWFHSDFTWFRCDFTWFHDILDFLHDLRFSCIDFWFRTWFLISNINFCWFLPKAYVISAGVGPLVFVFTSIS